MNEVALSVESVSDVFSILHELRELGYTNNKDFTFVYQPTNFNDHNDIPYKRIVITFTDEQLASWFRLKWEYKQ